MKFLEELNKSLEGANLPTFGDEAKPFMVTSDSLAEDAIFIEGYFLLYFGIEGHLLISNDYTKMAFDPYQMTLLLIHVHNAARICGLVVEVGNPMRLKDDGSIETLLPKQPNDEVIEQDEVVLNQQKPE